MGNSIFYEANVNNSLSLFMIFHQSWTWNYFDDYPLLPMGADPKYTTVSGFSAGSFMADTMYVTHSETFKGAGLHDGGPYGLDVNHPSSCLLATPDKEPTCFDQTLVGN